MKGIDIEELLKDYRPDPSKQAVLVYLNFPLGKLESKKALDAVFDLEDILMEVAEKAGVGDFDGNEFCDGPGEESVTFFMYGPDADAIHEVIAPVLATLPRLPGSYILKRYGGDVNAPEERIFL